MRQAAMCSIICRRWAIPRARSSCSIAAGTCSTPTRTRTEPSARTPKRSTNRRSDVARGEPPSLERVLVARRLLPTRADAQWPCILFPLACPVAASRGAVVERIRLGDALSVVLVTVTSLAVVVLFLDFATAGLGHPAAAATNNGAVVRTSDLRMGLLR